MTAVELYHELQERGVVLTPAPEGPQRALGRRPGC